LRFFQANLGRYFIVVALFQDCIGWANRSGGKTFNSAMVTWLDSVFKAGCWFGLQF
jgi:hypothetical protein